MNKILMIDDDMILTEMLTTYLGREGLMLTACHSGEKGLQKALQDDFSLVILDIMLPDIQGLEVLHRLRSESSVPVLMLTAKGDDIDKIVGLESGADDYLPKPFNPRELVARIRALIRRSSGAPLVSDVPTPLTVGTLTIDTATRTARNGEVQLSLTATEFDLLQLLMQHPGRMVTREFLYKNIFRRPHDPIDRSLDVHISNLRRKLGQTGDSHEWIQTIRGKGFLLSANESIS